jgi:hypothetical protein
MRGRDLGRSEKYLLTYFIFYLTKGIPVLYLCGVIAITSWHRLYLGYDKTKTIAVLRKN